MIMAVVTKRIMVTVAAATAATTVAKVGAKSNKALTPDLL
jgi:hypothetical protein